jgi:hypothetical protein
MTIFIPGTAVENTRNLAQSALPDSPVVADEPRGPGRRLTARPRLAALLHAAARRQERFADRLDPVRVGGPQLS